MLYSEIKVRIKGPVFNLDSEAEVEEKVAPLEDLYLREMIRSTVQQKLDGLDLELWVEVD